MHILRPVNETHERKQSTKTSKADEKKGQTVKLFEIIIKLKIH